MIANNLNSDSNSTCKCPITVIFQFKFRHLIEDWIDSDGLSTTVSPAISPKNEARGSPECHVSPTRSMSQWDSSCLMRSRSKSWTTSPITRRRPSAARSSSSGLSIDRFGYFATDCRNENTLKDPDTELEASTLPFISDDNRQDSAHSRTSVQSVSCPPVNFLQDFKTTRSFPPRNHVGGNDPIWFRRKFNFTPDQPTPRLQHMSARKKNLTVLIADDNSINIAIFERKLKKLGHDTMTTCDGNQAFEAFQKHKEKVDFILMDLNVSESCLRKQGYKKGHSSLFDFEMSSILGTMSISITIQDCLSDSPMDPENSTQWTRNHSL